MRSWESAHVEGSAGRMDSHHSLRPGRTYDRQELRKGQEDKMFGPTTLEPRSFLDAGETGAGRTPAAALPAGAQDAG